MLTDDELTRQLGEAMREATDDLAWNGRTPQARRTPNGAWLTVPAIAAMAGVGVLATQSDHVDRAPQAGTSASPEAGVSVTPSEAPMITDTIKVAGYSLTVQRRADEPLRNDAVVVNDTAVPDDARKLEVDGSAEAWVGTDAEGRNGMWIKSPIRFGGKLFAIVSPTWSQETMATVAIEGFPEGIDPQ